MKAASDIVSNEICFFCTSYAKLWPPQYAPVSGIIREINAQLNDQPGLLNKSPEAKGVFLGCTHVVITHLNRTQAGFAR